MALVPGARLGPYEIVGALGAGGMGEVFKARDTRLDRAVAVKILPAALAADPQFRGRFDREARAISQLTHPHICTLYDVGEHEGTAFLVMELLDGQTLGARLEKGALNLNDALRIAIEIAEGLEAAHRFDIVHRDLKPGNVMLTRIGVKLLDFGLAKASAPAVDASGSRLLTTPPGLTAPGTILGTVQYMAPEQIEGQEADARTDLFAFGCVLYEMLTGRTAFEGQTHASLIAAIMHVEPPLVSKAEPSTPRALDRVVKKCLAKQADDRWQSARDLRDELQWIAEREAHDMSAPVSSTPVAQSAGWRRAVPWTMAGVIAGLASAWLLWAPWRAASPTVPLRISAELGADASLPNSLLGAAATLSPDGAVVGFVAQKGDGGSTQIYVRRLNQLQATPLSGTDDAQSPFFSPDGQWVAFFAANKLKKIAVTGGPAFTICDAPNGRGGSWAEDGIIVLSPNNATPGTTLVRVSSDGGTPEPVTTLVDGEVTHRWPQLLPGGTAVLFTSSSSYDEGAFDDATLVVQTLSTGSRKVLLRGGYYGRYLPSGHLVYMHSGTLFTARFDLDRLEVTGQPVPALDGVASDASTGGAQFAVSDNGTLVYVPGQSTSSGMPIQLMDHEGKATTLRSSPTKWFNPVFAPDGRRLALNILDTQFDIWVYELARDTLSRLTADPASDTKPVWTPDGRRIVFASARGDKSTPNLYWQRADGMSDAERLTQSKNPQSPGSWHPSSKFLAFEEQTQQTKYDLMILPIEADEAGGAKVGKPTVLLNGPAEEREPMFSPDGRWLAYSSNDSGRYEVYVRPFPGAGSRWQISTDGGVYPTWSRTKDELFYGYNGQIMVAPFAVEDDSFPR